MSSAPTPIATSEMLAELSITFPALWKRPLSAYGPAYAGAAGVWTGEDGSHVMPDGLPIFFGPAGGESPYNGTVHEGFESWLHNRGWHCVRHEADTYHLLPGAPE